MKEKVTPQSLCDALMRDVYYPFSACVCLDADGNILSLWHFDAAFCTRAPRIAPGTLEAWLISSHPEGSMTPEPEDRHAAQRLREALCGLPLRTFITSEDDSCLAVAY